MEVLFPGVVDKMLQPEILRQLGFPVGEDGYVHWKDYDDPTKRVAP